MTNLTPTAFDIDAYQQWRASCFYPKADLPLPDAELRGKRFDDLGDASIARACSAALHEPVTALPLPDRGTFHRLWRIERPTGRSLICRANALRRWFRDFPLWIDFHVADRCAANDVPIVRSRAIDMTRTHVPTDFALVEEARGTSLQLLDDDETRIGPCLRELGRTLARVHRIEIEDGYGLLDVRPLMESRGELRGSHATWGEYLLTNLDAHVDLCISLEVIDEDEGKHTRRLFEDCRDVYAHARSVLLHGDPGNHNVFTANGKITALIDWEDAVAGDPVYDIAFWATFHPERRHATLIEGYRSEADLPADFEPRFWLYYLRVALAKTVLRHRLGKREAPGRQPASGRVRLGMQRLDALLV